MTRTNSNKSEVFMRSNCSLASSLELFGDKWTLLVVRDLFSGEKTYGELQSAAERIPTNILADRLKRLIECQVIEKIPYQAQPMRYKYYLTPRGQDLSAVLESLSDWGSKHIPGTDPVHFSSE